MTEGRGGRSGMKREREGGRGREGEQTEKLGWTEEREAESEPELCKKNPP